MATATISISGSVGRKGANRRDDVIAVQSLLNQHVAALGLPPLVIDGMVGVKTIGAIEAFQRKIGFGSPDGRVDPGGRTWGALTSGLSAPPSPSPLPAPTPSVPGAVRDESWPPKPDFQPLVNNEARAAIFGKFEYVHEPQPNNPENIRILGNWVRQNIVSVNIDMGPSVGARKVQFHRKASQQLQDLWLAWKDAGLLDRVLTYAGSFVPRFVRGSTKYLSNHSFGSAFDINVAWNGLGKKPALVGDKGSVRELVPIANQHGFYWGGHFGRLDGMHFEVAKLM